jgi:uncharacterized membrane protein
MSQENTMVVFTLDSKDKAAELLRRLQELDIADDNIEIKEAAFATKRSRGRVKLEQFNDLGGGRGAFGGGTIGLIAGTIVAGPVGAAVGGVVGAAVTGMYTRLRDSGVNDRFMKEVSEKLEPGKTNLFIIYSGTPGPEMLNTLREFDASLAHSSLPEEAIAALTQTYEESGEEVVSDLEVFTAEATEEDTEPTEADIEPLAAAPADDLTAIDGIGPKIAATLAAAGITTFDQLHRASEVQLRETLTEARVVIPRSLPTWPRQAGLAAAGDWKALYKLNSKRKLDSAKKA